MFSEFKKFAMRGNVLDLAVGVIIGASFSGIVNSLVKDVIMPPIGLALGGVDFSNFFLVIKGGPKESGALCHPGGCGQGQCRDDQLRPVRQCRYQLPDRRLRAVPAGAPDQPAAGRRRRKPPPRRRPPRKSLLLRDIRDSLKARG